MHKAGKKSTEGLSAFLGNVLGIGCFAFVSFLATSASALFVSDYAKWKTLDASDRATYAKGMFDAFMIAYPADDDIARAFGLDNCAADLKLSGEKLAEIVDDYYETTPKERDMPPFVVVNNVVVLGLCRQHINSERESRGLTPLVSAP